VAGTIDAMAPVELAQRVRAGEVRAGSRLISLVEAGDSRAEDVLRQLFPHTGRACVLGVTGPPGAGKSMLVRALIASYRTRHLKVGVLAVDPSSPFSMGALLGDRVRMGQHASDRSVFIRSMASRGQLGGIATATPAAIRVLDAMGFDRIIVETVGVGQSEIAVAQAADCTVLVLMPGTGDSIQTMKAGIMEIGDVFVINKADREGASELRREVSTMLHLRPDRGILAQVLMTRADRGEGVEAVVAAAEAHLKATEASGQMHEARLRQLKREALDLVAGKIRRSLIGGLDAQVTERLIDALRNRRLDPAAVADELFAVVMNGSNRSC
jgi:LAO/AO transport system kinase